jgi:hypothetical protein
MTFLQRTFSIAKGGLDWQEQKRNTPEVSDLPKR